MSADISIASGAHVVLGAGPVGRAVARRLLAEDDATVVLASRRPIVGDALGAAARLSSVSCDLLDAAAVAAACRGARTVTFAAAPPYHRWPELFPALQRNAVAAAAAAEAVFIAAENLYGYGAAGRLTEDAPLAANTRKGRTRAAMSDALFRDHEAGRVIATAGRASDLFGAEMALSALGSRVWPALFAGRTIDWIGDPDAPHTFTWIDDYADALVRLGATPEAWGRAWHVPSPPDLPVRAVVERAADIAGVAAPRLRRLPKAVLRLVGVFDRTAREVIEMTYQFESPFHMDHSAFRNAFGVQATPWEDALRATVDAWRPSPAA